MSQKHELIEFARMETYRKKDIRLESVKWGEIFQFLETSGFHVLGSYINLSIVLVGIIYDFLQITILIKSYLYFLNSIGVNCLHSRSVVYIILKGGGEKSKTREEWQGCILRGSASPLDL